MREWMRKIFESDSGVSSKRICGVTGWMVSLAIGIYCTVMEIQAPECVNALLLCCLGLLGVDSVAGIWKGGNGNNKDNNKDK